MCVAYIEIYEEHLVELVKGIILLHVMHAMLNNITILCDIHVRKKPSFSIGVVLTLSM